MVTAKRIRSTYFHSRPVIAPLMAFFSLLVLLLVGCQTTDSMTGDRKVYKPLAVAFAVPPPKFAGGVVASGFATPMAMEFAPDGRLFVLEKSGAVKIVGVATPFLTLSVDQNTERGLMGIAFDPNWATDKKVYIHYSVPGANRNRVSIFSVSSTDPNKANPTGTTLFDLDPLTNSAYHNGGALHFGKDGYLYLATGDNRLPSNGQADNLLGKMLRFGKTLSGTAGIPTMPPNNPFNFTGKNRAIWAYGLRNPFTFAVQPGTGRIFVNDIGEAGYEEINEATVGGLNFGWPNSEGPANIGAATAPIGGYVNGYAANGNQYNVGKCAIIGSAFYNPTSGNQQFPADYLGDYFYGDHCDKEIKVIDLSNPSSATTFATALSGLVMDIKVGPDGAVYYLTLNGVVGKITYTGTDAPTIATHPASQTVSVNRAVTFSVQANGGNLSYQWQKSGVNIAGANGTSHSIASAQLSDNGSQYRVIVTNAFGSATSNIATLTVSSNQPPAASISTPAVGSKFSGGQTISYSGTATDPEDGTLGAAAFTWKVELVHGSHTHPLQPVSGVMSGSFPIPVVNEVSSDIKYRVTLEVTDSKGLKASVSRNIDPNLVTINVATVPAGLQFRLDDQPKTSPFSFVGVVGIQRSLEAFSQTFNGLPYFFKTWSNGQAAKHNILTPNVNTAYTATYGNVGGVINLPGRIQAEDYKAGGQGVGYNDLTTGNTGGRYRTDNVDIENTADVDGGYNVGWIQAGEWLAYDVNVAATGIYTMTMRMASGTAGTKTITVTVDGGNAKTFNFTDASGYQSWKNVVVSGVNLTAGNHVLRITMTAVNFNLNYLDVQPEAVNLLLNGDFSNGIVNWQTYFQAPATGTIANEAGAARISITNAGVNPWDIQIYQARALTSGKLYTLDFDIKAEATPKSFRVVIEHNGDPWTKYHDLPYTVNAAANTYQHFSIPWTQSAADAGGRVVFDFGANNLNDVWLDNVFLK